MNITSVNVNEQEYMEVVRVYLNIVDVLLTKNKAANRRICIWTMDGQYGNVRPNAFKTLVTDAVGRENYRKYMKVFRTFEWIICQSEKFSNVQWIDGRSIRVVTFDFEKYNLMKELLGEPIILKDALAL